MGRESHIWIKLRFGLAPRLDDWSHDALVKWEKARVQYEETVRQRCRESGERPEVAMKPVKSSIDRKLLEVLCLYELRKAVENVINEEISMLIQQRISTVKNEQIPDLDELFGRSLKMDLTEDDIDARVLKYYRDFSTIIENHGLVKILRVGDPKAEGYAGRMKLRCTILIDNLEPRMVRDDVQRYCKYECREVKKNDFTLFSVIKEKARAQHKYHQLALEQKTRMAPSRKNESSIAKAKAGKANKRAVDPSTAAPTSTRAQTPRKELKPPKSGCWHCQGEHWLRDCPTATDEDRARAAEKMKEVKERAKVKTVQTAPQPGEVLVNNLLALPYCADSGSDLTIIPRTVVDDLVALGNKVDVFPLPHPVEATVAGGSTVICQDVVTVDIVLQTAVGTVHLREVKCLIMEGSETDFLLGNDTLVSLGIDVNHQLEQLAGGDIPEDSDPFEANDRSDVDLSAAEVHGKLVDMVVAAGDNGFDPAYLAFLHDTVTEYEDIFRIDIGADPPAEIEPLRIKLVDDAKPFRARARRYAPAQHKFLREYAKRFEQLGLIRQNNQSHWACAAVPVAKPKSPGEFRMTIDYRPVNAMTVPIACSAQDVVDSAEEAEGAYGFADFDMPKGFWQLPLHPDSQAIMSFVTTDTVYTPNRVAQGATDSATHFQNEMQRVHAKHLYKNLLVWIDDILVYAKDAPTFIEALKKFFDTCRARRLKLSVSKSCLFQKEIRWCGRIFIGAGIRHDPARGVARVCGRTKKMAAGAKLTWTTAEEGDFTDAKQLLSSSQLLHFPKPTAIVAVFSDVSELGWGLVITQVESWVPDLPADQQQHQLLICKSGVFDETERRWSIIKKEAYPIIWAARNLGYLLIRPTGFRLFCDHTNLIYLFSPSHEVKRHVRGKLQRWALFLTGLGYSIEHIDGSANVWADLLSRWGSSSPGEVGMHVKCKFVTRSQQRLDDAVDQQLNTLRPRHGDFVFPSIEDVQQAQQMHKATAPAAVVDADYGTMMLGNCIWIPEIAKELRQRILIVAHCGSQGHRGLEPMVTTIGAIFLIRNLEQHCRQFLRRCLLCKHVKGGNVIPHPWGPTYNATERNEMLHWDYLFLGDSVDDNKYLLVIKDGLTHFCELVVAGAATSMVAASALADWTKRFGPPKMLISDQGSHFKNEVVQQMCRQLAIEQDLVLAYAPWINGTIERLNRDVLRVLRVLLMEMNLDTHEWEYLVPLVQTTRQWPHWATSRLESYLQLYHGPRLLNQ
ncbi:unnamed protein product [Phytophthora fragariaefolia]|uniref:RNA-directed DNA polymerase n=1 Tax=Phytophthora fragariaefolia TaxID=1490495 RepID=A0A9W7D0E2_9STRA|nr:unnamed protein product [Phytophthora fragariaefolia]